MKTETNSKIGRLNLRFEVENYIQKFNLFYLVRVLLMLAGSKKKIISGDSLFCLSLLFSPTQCRTEYDVLS